MKDVSSAIAARMQKKFKWMARTIISTHIIMGTLAIVMPVLAAAALSLAAAMDLEAQEHTYRGMLAFLRQQENNLAAAASEGDCRALVLETESVLLGETANWFSRRSFSSVA